MTKMLRTPFAALLFVIATAASAQADNDAPMSSAVASENQVAIGAGSLVLFKSSLLSVRPAFVADPDHANGTPALLATTAGSLLTSIMEWSSGTFPLLVALVVIGVVGLTAAARRESGPGRRVTHTVVIKSTTYVPVDVTVRRGDTVEWINEDPFPHTVTSTGAFDSKSIGGGGSWKYTALRAGEFAYTCTFHPHMKGTLSVH